MNQLELFVQVINAGVRLFLGRLAIAGRATLDDVANVNVRGYVQS
jgi:hypothetical protein